MKFVEIHDEAPKGARILFLSKNLDDLNSQEVREELAASSFADKSPLVLDLKNVKHLSSAGLSIFISVKKRVHLMTEIRIENADSNLRHIFHVVSFDKLFKIG